MDATKALMLAGGHFVLLDPDRGGKRPLPGTPWRYRQHWRVVEAWGGPLGLIPGSLDALVADVDEGDPERLWRGFGRPWLALDTRRGLHGWFDRWPDPDFTRAPFRAAGCKGDVIQSRAYVKLHGDGAARLARALPTRRPAVLRPEILGVEEEAWTADPAAALKEARPPAEAPALEEAKRGQRNEAVFHAVRLWALSVPAGDRGSMERWVARCRAYALQQRLRLPDLAGYGEREALTTGKSVAQFTWKVKFDHSLPAQFRRGVKRFYGDARPETKQAVQLRQARVLELLADGLSTRAVAAATGYSQARVHQLKARLRA